MYIPDHDIYFFFLVPQTFLQGDNEAECTDSIISQLKDFKPECKIVHWKTCQMLSKLRKC